MHTDDATFLHHAPCPECGSSDANAVYDDGHTYCFACEAYSAGDGEPPTSPRRKRMSLDLIHDVEIRGLRARKITEETCRKFGYGVGKHKGHSVQVAPYYDADGNLVGQKVRGRDKKFAVLGSLKEALPFGAHVWPRSGKKIVVTEGEIDALSMSQVQGNQWPVVSIPNGAQSARKHIARNLDYYRGFDEVVLMFDSDEPGREAARAAAEVLGPRARIAELPGKDPNDMLASGQTKELIDAMWRALPFRPEGIKDLASLREAVLQPPQWGLSWPFERLTSLTYGIRSGEIYAFGAGTGVGKTDFFTQTMKHLISHHGEKVGIFAFEQEPRETAVRLVGKFAERTFHIPDAGWTVDDLATSWDEMVQSGQVFLYDSFGNNDWESVRAKIEYLVHAEDVRYIFIDHLTALATWEEDERKALDSIMSDMGSLVKQLKITIFLISHLSTPDGKPHEEGGRVMIRHFRGSRSIGYWCHYMFGLERDQQAEDPLVRQTTTFRVLKDRFTGRATGEVIYLGYDHDTGMLHEVSGEGMSPTSAEDAGFDVTPNSTANTDDF